MKREKLVFKYGDFFMEKWWTGDTYPPMEYAVMKPLYIDVAIDSKIDVTEVKRYKLLFRLRDRPMPGQYWFYEFVREE